MKSWKIVWILALCLLLLQGCSRDNLTKEFKKDAAEALFIAAIKGPYSGIYEVKPIKIVYIKYKFYDQTEIQSNNGMKFKAYPVKVEGEGYFTFSYDKWAKATATGYVYKNEFGENKFRLEEVERDERPLKGSLSQDMAKRFPDLNMNTPTQYPELP